MNISKKFDKVAFNNAVCKLMLNIPAIENIIFDFSKKNFSEWEDRDCSYCEEDKLCKKHRAVERVLQSDRAIQIVGLNMPEPLSGLYISKSDMFVFNPANNSCLIIDCPPLFTNGSNEKLNDSWVRRIIPFTFGEFNKTNKIQIEQTVDIKEVMTHRSLTCSFSNGNGYNLLVLQNNYGMYHWEIEPH